MEDHRGCVRSSLALAAVFAASVLAGSAYGQGAVPDVSGTYWATQYNAKVQIVGGGDLPLTAKGKAAYEKNADSGPSRTVIPAHRGQHSGDRGQFLMSV
jgi:hypothetical protein